MMFNKGALNSKTIIGACVMILTFLFGWSGARAEAFGADLTQIAEIGGALFGFILTVYGRYKAANGIKGLVGTKPASYPTGLLFAIILTSSMFAQGCAGLQPKNPSEGLAVARAEYSAVMRTATDLRAAGVIDDALAVKLNMQFNRLEAALDLAQGAIVGNQEGEAAGYLNAVTELLLLIQKEVGP